MMGNSTGLQVLPDDLIAFAWSAPMRDLAAKIGISDVALKKLLRGYGVAPPPQGYWNRVHAGRAVPARPHAPARGPGSSNRIRLDQRFAGHVMEAAPYPVDGPFASSLVPESLDDLRQTLRTAIARVGVPALSAKRHPGLDDLFRREAARRDKKVRHHWAEAPYFETVYWQRQPRFFNALFLALARRGGGGVLREQDRGLDARARVGDTGVRLDLAPAGRVRTELRGGYHRPASDLAAKTPLVLLIDGGRDREPFARYADDGDGTLDRKLPDIVADVIVAGEAGFRRGLREHQEWLAQQRRFAEEARERRLAEEERRRGAELEKHATSLRMADDIRALVARVAASGPGAAGVERWSAWALARADRLDPVGSGALFGEFAAMSGLEPDFT